MFAAVTPGRPGPSHCSVDHLVDLADLHLVDLQDTSKPTATCSADAAPWEEAMYHAYANTDVYV